MPISLQVQIMRHAISPRFAIRSFLNLRGLNAIETPATKKHKRHTMSSDRKPISLQVQIMRHAISPRFAIRIFLNLRGLNAIETPATKKHKRHKMSSCAFCVLLCALLWLNSKKRLAVLYRLAILDINLYYFTTRLGLNLVHELHGLDDAHDRLRFDVTADLHERIRRGRWRTIKRADDWRRNHVQILILRSLRPRVWS